MGRDGFIGLLKAWRTGFPDGHMVIDDLLADGDLGVVRNTWHGTHTGEFYGVPPSGERVEVTFIGIDRVVDGRVTEGWGELDMVGMMQRVKALPPVGPGAVARGCLTGMGPAAELARSGPAAGRGQGDARRPRGRVELGRHGRGRGSG